MMYVCEGLIRMTFRVDVGYMAKGAMNFHDVPDYATLGLEGRDEVPCAVKEL